MFWNKFDDIIQASSVSSLTETAIKDTLVKYLVNDWNVPVLDFFTSAKLNLFIKEGNQ